MRSRYLIPVLLAGVLLSAGCRRGVSYYERPPIDGLRFTATAEVLGAARDTLRVGVVARNEGRHRRLLEHDMCNDPVAVRLYPATTTFRQSGKPRWDAIAWRQTTRSPNEVCLAGAAMHYILPDSSVEVAQVWLPVQAMLGDSLAPGRYRLTARLDGNGWDAGEIDAGIVELRLPPP